MIPARLLLVGHIVLGACVASGQDYPNKPIRVVTAEAGGGTDFTARLIAQGLSGPMGQQVIVDNRGGAGGIYGGIAARATPDGYTLLVAVGTLWTLPLLQKTPYDPVRSFSPITLAASSPSIFVVHPSVPAKSVKELIALAKAKPGSLNYGSGPTGSPNHLTAELFKSMAGISIVQIPYKGAGPALNALIGGEVQLMFPTVASVTPHLKSGRLSALAVTSAKPSALAPGLLTIAESGVPGYESVTIYGVFAPAKTPETICQRLHREIVKVLKAEATKERFFTAGIETVGSSPEEFSTKMKSEMVRLAKVIKDAGIRPD